MGLFVESVQNTAIVIIDSLILALVFLMLWGGHWTRWHYIPGFADKGGQLHRLLAYSYGVGCILIGFFLWAATRAWLGMDCLPLWKACEFLVMDVFCAALGTVLPRFLRAMGEAQARRGDAVDYEQAIEDKRRDA